MELLLPGREKRQPLHQTAAVLLLGQSFDTGAEFLIEARRAIQRITAEPPFNATKEHGSWEGRLQIFGDACLGIDLGLLTPVPTAPGALGLDSNGAKLQQYLENHSLPQLPGAQSGDLPLSADQVWSLTSLPGPTAKLIAILRKPQNAAPPAEYYDLPVVAVDVSPGRAWHLVIVRALAQLMGGLADEYTRGGLDWKSPPQAWLTDPDHPGWPHNAARLGPNVILVNSTQIDLLGSERIQTIVPDLDDVWLDPDGKALDATPYRPTPGGAVIGDSPLASIRLMQGAAGFRTGVLRTDASCLLAQVPASRSE